MTHLERFIELYKDFGIELKPEPCANGFRIVFENNEHPKLGGYIGFGTEVFFTEQGEFIQQNFWE